MPALARRAVDRTPLVALAGMILAGAMLLPALHASVLDAHDEARAFLYWALILATGFAFVALAARRPEEEGARGQLLALVAAFALLPLAAAAPVIDLRPEAGAGRLWVEMIAAATTTGGTLVDPASLSPSLHLWRALVGWLGGLLVWIAAAAILAPLSLGGFEVLRPTGPRMRIVVAGGTVEAHERDPRTRIGAAATALGPIYVALSLGLWGILAALGADPTQAAIHAMATLSTSGIQGIAPPGAATGLAGEALVALFLVFALSRRTFATDLHRGRLRGLAEDREMRMAIAIVAAVVAVLFLRHWAGAFEVDGIGSLRAGLGALWGTAFTALSFLTTTGFVSAEWATARAWSGLDSPGVLLMGLAVAGGGVATTAGGIKLLRVYALYAHGRREMDLLVHPHAAGGHGAGVRRLTREGVEAAWVFFMLFLLSLAGATLAFAATGVGFEAALVLAVSALSTCGPLAAASAAPGAVLADLPGPAMAVFGAAMVLGRLEALALIALFNPAFWRA